MDQEAAIKKSKQQYSASLQLLAEISEEIHQRRLARKAAGAPAGEPARGVQDAPGAAADEKSENAADRLARQVAAGKEVMAAQVEREEARRRSQLELLVSFGALCFCAPFAGAW
jgi:hypothetical protein